MDVTSTIADWERRTRLLAEAVDLKTTDIMDDDMIAAEAAVNIILQGITIANTPRSSRN